MASSPSAPTGAPATLADAVDALGEAYASTGKVLKEVWGNVTLGPAWRRTALQEFIFDEQDACAFVACACNASGNAAPQTASGEGGAWAVCVDGWTGSDGIKEALLGDDWSFYDDLRRTLPYALLALLLLAIPMTWLLVRRHKRNQYMKRKGEEWVALLSKGVERLTQSDAMLGKYWRDVGESYRVDVETPTLFRTSSATKTRDNASDEKKHAVFVITDIEDSTLLADSDPVVYREVQEVHDLIIRDALDGNFGFEINTEGDSFQCVFQNATHAFLFCQRVQENLLKHEWSDQVLKLPRLGQVISQLEKRVSKSNQVIWQGPRVRMGVHAATEDMYDTKWNSMTGMFEFSGHAFELAGIISGVASGGQILTTQDTVDMLRKEAGIFHMNTFHLGAFQITMPPQLGLMGEDVVSNLYQAMPSSGLLAHRSFPQIASLPQLQPAVGLSLTKPPPVGDVCFVSMRIDAETKSGSRSTVGTRSTPLSRTFSVFAAPDSGELDNFWTRQNAQLRQQLETPLRSWMQQFGGYELCENGKNSMLVVFSETTAAVKFCMVAQIGLLLTRWSADVLSHPSMRIVKNSDKHYIFRGPRLAMSILPSSSEGHTRVILGGSSPTRSNSTQRGTDGEVCDTAIRKVSFAAGSDVLEKVGKSKTSLSSIDDFATSANQSRFSEYSITERSSTTKKSIRQAMAQGIEKMEEMTQQKWQHSYFLINITSSLFVRSKSLVIGDYVTRNRKWFASYPATGCSAFCGSDITPSAFLGQKHVVMFFYFADRTAGCQMEAKYFRDYYTYFTQEGAEVIGVSLDGEERHMAHADSQHLPYPLISDRPGGLNAIFGGPNVLARSTYVIASSGELVSKYTTLMVPGALSDPYSHVTNALAKVQELSGPAPSATKAIYTGSDVELCNEVCDLTDGGHITFIQQSENANTVDLWDYLPSHGGASRPSIADLGTHELKSSKVVSLFAVTPSMLLERYAQRKSLRGKTERVVRPGAHDAPNPNDNVAIVFTFPTIADKTGNSSRELSASSSGSSIALSKAKSGKRIQSYVVLGRQMLSTFEGYECQEVGQGNCMLAFPTAAQALKWCVAVQAKLTEQNKYPKRDDSLICNVKMGIAFGKPAYGKPHSRTGRQDYFGPVVNLAARIAKEAKPGQVLLDSEGVSESGDSIVFTREDEEVIPLARRGAGETRIALTRLGMFQFKGFRNAREVLQATALG